MGYLISPPLSVPLWQQILFVSRIIGSTMSWVIKGNSECRSNTEICRLILFMKHEFKLELFCLYFFLTSLVLTLMYKFQR